MLDQEDGLARKLEGSLRQAKKSAQTELRRDLFCALEWPETVAQYEDYLKRFVRWVPRQSDAQVWRGQDPDQRQGQEVNDRLSHFYFLVNQKVGGDAPQDSEVFRGWMTDFARQWGSFLDSTESFSPQILQSFIANAPEYRIHESLVQGAPNMPSGWLTFNQFIARELNGGLRPITEPTNNLVVTSPADCIFEHAYDIDADSDIPATTIKNTHKYGNVKQLLEGSEYSDSFANGTFVHYELPPSAYHRFHVPVAGQVKESFTISGQVFLEVVLEDHELKSRDTTSSGYEFFQTRGVLTIDTAASGCGDIGVVAVVPVGMAHVSSVVLTAVTGTHLPKGEEFGYFQFGGSDIIILFQDGLDPQVDTSEGLRFVGTPVARCTALSS
ncbi:MAG: phosphatidylserine decarboxylase [Mycobacterium sp.]|nr:phosphatidylserine decarboxylase [Mycobacterium sp.]